MFGPRGIVIISGPPGQGRVPVLKSRWRRLHRADKSKNVGKINFLLNFKLKKRKILPGRGPKHVYIWGFAVPVFKKHQSRVILVFRLAILSTFKETGPFPVHFARMRARAFVTYRVGNPGKSN